LPKIISNAVWQVLTQELDRKHLALEQAQARIDRLVEALGRRDRVPIFMPQTPTINSNPDIALEASEGWFDKVPFPALKPPGGNSQ
jgi:hypothetical protein